MVKNKKNVIEKFKRVNCTEYNLRNVPKEMYNLQLIGFCDNEFRVYSEKKKFTEIVCKSKNGDFISFKLKKEVTLGQLFLDYLKKHGF